jgi:very-long-chain enoyl-CoA reductase
MGLCHFVKRLVECIFVHYYSKPTKPIGGIIREMGYYWLFFGLIVPFFLLHPRYNTESPLLSHILPKDSLQYLYHALTAVFGFSEVMNLLCHLHLKSFRRGDHDFTRGIPRFHGFSAVTCANYFWEFLAWVSFALVS